MIIASSYFGIVYSIIFYFLLKRTYILNEYTNKWNKININKIEFLIIVLGTFIPIFNIIMFIIFTIIYSIGLMINYIRIRHNNKFINWLSSPL